jgi:hypothetical protein
LLPPGEFIDPIERPLEQANAFERLQRNSSIRPGQRKYGPQRTMRTDAAEQNILQRRKTADQMMLLKNHSRAPAVFLQRTAIPENRTPVFDDDIALGWCNQPVQASKQGRLARP